MKIRIHVELTNLSDAQFHTARALCEDAYLGDGLLTLDCTPAPPWAGGKVSFSTWSASVAERIVDAVRVAK